MSRSHSCWLPRGCMFMMPEGCLVLPWVRPKHLCRSIQVLYKPKPHSQEDKAVLCQLQALQILRWWFKNLRDCFKKYSQLRRGSCLSFTQRHLILEYFWFTRLQFSSLNVTTTNFAYFLQTAKPELLIILFCLRTQPERHKRPGDLQ